MPDEDSMPWQAGAGDGRAYSADEWGTIIETLGLSGGANVGVVPGFDNELLVSSSGDNALDIATGRAITGAKRVFTNGSERNLTSDDPAAATGRRVVLQDDWSARESRLVIISSDDGVTDFPALTQNWGVLWENPLAGFEIAADGAISNLTDERKFTLAAVPAKGYISRAGQTRWSLPGWMWGDEYDNGDQTADIIYLTPILVQEVRTFDRIGMEVTTLAAGEVARLGIYKAHLDVDGLVPSSLVVDAGTVSVAVAGPTDVEAVIDEELAPGYYFVAVVTESGTPRFVGIDYTAAGISCPVTGRAADTGLSAQHVILKTDANGGADWPNNGLPDPCPAVTTIVPPFFAHAMLRDSS